MIIDDWSLYYNACIVYTQNGVEELKSKLYNICDNLFDNEA